MAFSHSEEDPIISNNLEKNYANDKTRFRVEKLPRGPEEVGVGHPVYLTKNGTGRYVLIDIADYAKVEEAAQLSIELMRGRSSGETNGWIDKKQMRSHFSERINA